MKYPEVRRLSRFEYLAPGTIEEAISLLSQHNGKARVIAGGTDLLSKMKRREDSPQYLIGLKNIPGLDYIRFDEGQGLTLGPLATIHAIETSTLIKDKFLVLAQAASVMASAQIRSLGTVIGNLCSAVPSADMAPGLIILGANLKIVSARGERTIPVGQFFTGPSESALTNGELVVAVQVPNPPAGSGMVYIKHTTRAAMELAIAGVAALVTLPGGVCSDARIALGAVAPIPIRATRAEGMLRGKPLDAELVQQAAETASEEASPITDIRSTAEYRREMVRVLTQRALNQAKEMAS